VLLRGFLENWDTESRPKQGASSLTKLKINWLTSERIDRKEAGQRFMAIVVENERGIRVAVALSVLSGNYLDGDGCTHLARWSTQ